MSIFISNIPQIRQKIEKAQRLGLRAAAVVIVQKIQLSLSIGGPPSSNPGKPPAMRSGRLRQSVSTDESGLVQRVPSIDVGLDMAVGGVKKTPPWLYGKFLEGGTARMRPRPFIAPMLTETTAKSEAKKAFDKTVREKLK